MFLLPFHPRGSHHGMHSPDRCHEVLELHLPFERRGMLLTGGPRGGILSPWGRFAEGPVAAHKK